LDHLVLGAGADRTPEVSALALARNHHFRRLRDAVRICRYDRVYLEYPVGQSLSHADYDRRRNNGRLCAGADHVLGAGRHRSNDAVIADDPDHSAGRAPSADHEVFGAARLAFWAGICAGRHHDPGWHLDDERLYRDDSA